MVRALNVAEKPSVAKEVSRILSNGSCSNRPSFSKYNRIYEFGYNEPGVGAGLDMVVTSVTGHLCGIDFTSTFQSWSRVDARELFDAPLETQVKSPEIARTLRSEAARADWLILWLDCDREGEAIAEEVRAVAAEGNPGIVVKRARFSALIPAQIHGAMRNLCPLNYADINAVLARQELDLRIGAAFTRFQTLALQRELPAQFPHGKGAVSYGPCQFPTLGFVVDRYKEWEAFVPSKFWKIDVRAKLPDPGAAPGTQEMVVNFAWRRGRVFDFSAAVILYEAVMENPVVARVFDVDAHRKNRRKPLPLTTVDLQSICSRKLRMSSAKTMAVAEKLYQQGYLSYPRTETNTFEDGMDLIGLVKQQADSSAAWSGFAASLLTPTGTGWSQRASPPRSGSKDDHSHPPIHPTKAAGPSTLSGDEKKVYEMVTRHFLAVCSIDAYGEETVVNVQIGPEVFSTTGLIIKERGFLEVYSRFASWNAKSIPDFVHGMEFSPMSILLHQGETTPPSFLTEADLIALMDKNGIGTDATIAQHIETILTREYVVKQNNHFVPTTLGMALVEAYTSMGLALSKPHLRAITEAELNEIAHSTRTREDVVSRNIEAYLAVFDKVISSRALFVGAIRRRMLGGGRPAALQTVR